MVSTAERWQGGKIDANLEDLGGDVIEDAEVGPIQRQRLRAFPCYSGVT